MKKVFLFFVMFVLVSVSSFASPIPELLPGTTDNIILPPPIFGEFPEQSPSELEAISSPISDYEQVDLSNSSGIYHYVPAKKNNSLEPVPQFSESTYSIPGFDFYTDSIVLGSVSVGNDFNQDMEPAIIAVEINGTVYTTTSYFKYVNGVPIAYSSATTDFSTYSTAQLPLPAGYTWSVDPLLDANIYTNGISPKRIYLAGLLLDNSMKQNSRIVLWRSDNGGFSWVQPITVAQGSSPTGGAGNVDKPDVAVSWHSGTRGYVYVAYVILNGGNTQLWVKRSINGGASFPVASLLAAGNINGA